MREWPGLHEVGDEHPVFRVRVPDPRSNSGLRGSLHAGKLVRGIAYHLIAEDFQETGISAHEDLKDKRRPGPSGQKLTIFEFMRQKPHPARALDGG